MSFHHSHDVNSTSPCDQCLHRKVRCDRFSPRCRRCFDASLACTREVIRKRPGRKKGSGTAISRLKALEQATSTGFHSVESFEEQVVHEGDFTGNSNHASQTLRLLQTTSPNSTDSVIEDGVSPERSNVNVYLSRRTIGSQTASGPLGRFGSLRSRRSSFQRPSDVFSTLPKLSPYIDLFFAKLYPIWPIVPQSKVREYLYNPEQLGCHETCLILVMCALSAIHVPSSTSSTLENRRLVGQRFVDQCLQIRASFDYIETANLITIQTSLFLSCCEVEFQRTRSSWFLLQEAILLAEELEFNKQDRTGLDPSLDQVTVLSIQRTLYHLSLTERGLTILRNKPFAMIVYDSLPQERFEDEDPAVLVGLQILNRLFGLLDRQFLDAWVKGTSDGAFEQEQTRAKMLAAQENLSSMQLAQFEINSLTDIQKADILITQQWLRLVFWQACMRQGFLSSAAKETVLTYQFPCEVARALCAVLQSLPTNAILIHGVAIFERIFEITYSFMDCLSIGNSLSFGLEELRILFRVLGESPNSHSTYIQILKTKLINQTTGDGERLVSLIYQSP